MSNITDIQATNIYYFINKDIATHHHTATRLATYLEQCIKNNDYEGATLYKRDIIAHRTAIYRLNLVLNDLLKEININDLWT